MIHGVLVKAGDSARMPQADYSQCTHPVLVKNGFDPTRKRGKSQRLLCRFCKHQFTEGAEPLEQKRLRSARDLMRGLSIRAVSRRTGISRQAVRRVREWMLTRCQLPEHRAGRPRRKV